VLGEEPGHEVTGVSAQQRLEALEIPWLGVRESALVLENWRTWITRTLERFEDGVDYVLAEAISAACDVVEHDVVHFA
jgi:hypothetical protein